MADIHLMFLKPMKCQLSPHISMVFPYDHMKQIFKLTVDDLLAYMAGIEYMSIEWEFRSANPKYVDWMKSAPWRPIPLPKRYNHIYILPQAVLNHYLFPKVFYISGSTTRNHASNPIFERFFCGLENYKVLTFPCSNVIPTYNLFNMMGLQVSLHVTADSCFYCPITGLYVAHTGECVRYPAIICNGGEFRASPMIGMIVAIFIEHSNATYFRARSRDHPEICYATQYAVNLRSLMPFHLVKEGCPIHHDDRIVNSMITTLLDPKHYKAIASKLMALKYRDLEPEKDRSGKPNRDKKGNKRYLIPAPVLRSYTTVLLEILKYMKNLSLIPGNFTCVVRTVESDQFLAEIKVLHQKPILTKTYNKDDLRLYGLRDTAAAFSTQTMATALDDIPVTGKRRPDFVMPDSLNKGIDKNDPKHVRWGDLSE
jgi:hypothetical protein